MPTMPAILRADSRGRAVDHLRRYFGLAGGPAFTGSRFETIGGGGSSPDVANDITAMDIVSLSMLSISVPGAAAQRLLEDADFIETTRGYLAELPIDTDLIDYDRHHLTAGPAASLWGHLRQLRGFGPTTTSKLMARKRPRLIPVYDSVIERAFDFESSSGQWEYWHDLLSSDERRLHIDMEGLREEAGLTKEISAIRVLDVVVWMEQSRPSDDTSESSSVEI